MDSSGFLAARAGRPEALNYSKFLTRNDSWVELLQFRHLNEAQASDDDDVDSEGETLMEDGW